MAAQNGTGFTNLSQILNANQGNQLGSTVQKGLAGNVSGLQNQVNSATQQFNTQANAANENTAANQNTISSAIQNIVNAPANVNAPQGQTAPTAPASTNTPTSSAPTTPTPIPMPTTQIKTAATPSATAAAAAPTPAAATPTAGSTPAPTATTAPTAAAGSFGVSTPGSGTNQTSQVTGVNAPSAGTLAQFAQMLQGQYNGPQSLSNYAQLLSNAQNLQSQGQNANTSGGQQALLQQYAGGKNYTQGEQGLDQLLLGQSQPQLQSIINSTRNLTNVPTQANNQAQQLAQSTAAGNQNFAQGIQNQLTTAENPILGNIQNQISALNAKNAPINSAGTFIQSLLNQSPTPTTATSGALTGHGLGGVATTPTAQAQMAINAANSAGLLNPNQYQQLGTLITQMAASGQNPEAALSAAFSNNPAATATLQQGATGTQAAQLNALEQLGGNTQQYNTYGGAPTSTASFDMSKLPSVASAPAAVQPPELPPGSYLTTSGQVQPISTLENSSGQQATYTPGSALSQYQGLGGSIAQINAGAGGALINPGETYSNQNDLGGFYSSSPEPSAINYTPNAPGTGFSGYTPQVAAAHGGEIPKIELSDIMKPTDTFFCTELYKRKLLSRTQSVFMAKFFLKAMFHRTNMCLFYATHGEYIASTANKYDFDWSSVQNLISTNVIELMKEGKKDAAFDSYSFAIRKLCLKYNETRFLWNDRNMNCGFFEMIKCFPKVLVTKTFKNALKVYVNSYFI